MPGNARLNGIDKFKAKTIRRDASDAAAFNALKSRARLAHFDGKTATSSWKLDVKVPYK